MKFHKIIAFCSHPITAFFRFKDVFQIYPLDFLEAPKSELIKIFPFVLEFCLTEHDQIELDGSLVEVGETIKELTAQVNFQNKILKLLTIFSNFYFFNPQMSPQWFVRVEGLPEEELNEQTSVAGFNFYRFPKWKETYPIKEFAKFGFDQIKLQEHPQCFQLVDIEGKEPVSFSRYIVGAFHNYFLLSKEQQAVVDSAAELINQGGKLKNDMKSLSFIAFISSIETMVANEYKDIEIEKCSKCGQDQYKVMAKFRDYLFEYATSNAEAKKRINDLYSLRSKIAHTGILLYGDGKIEWSNSKEKADHFNMHLESRMLAKLSLMNWILFRGNRKAK